MNTKVDRLGNFDLCDHGVSLEFECEHCALLPGAKIARLTIEERRKRFDSAMESLVRKAVEPRRESAILVAIGLVCFAVGLLMGSAL